MKQQYIFHSTSIKSISEMIEDGYLKKGTKFILNYIKAKSSGDIMLRVLNNDFKKLNMDYYINMKPIDINDIEFLLDTNMKWCKLSDYEFYNDSILMKETYDEITQNSINYNTVHNDGVVTTNTGTFVTEGKQLGNLYHFTDISNLLKIINNNKFKLSDNRKDLGDTDIYHYIPEYAKKYNNFMSLTRNKLMPYFSKTKNVRIEIDGDKLSQKYKIEPINYRNIVSGEDKRHIQKFNEYEERLMSNDDSIENFIKYIKRIDFKLDFQKYDDKLSPLVNLLNELDYYSDEETVAKFGEILEKNNIEINIYKWDSFLAPFSPESKLNKIITEEVITEGKQLGNLYHFTNNIDAVSIISENEFRTKKTINDLPELNQSNKSKLNMYYQNSNFISFTRNKNFDWNTVRFNVDGTKLANKYKFRPIHFKNLYHKIEYEFDSEPEYRNSLDVDRNMGNQYEERLLTDDEYIKDFLSYVKSIDFTFYKITEKPSDVDNFEELVDLLWKLIINSSSGTYRIARYKDQFKEAIKKINFKIYTHANKQAGKYKNNPKDDSEEEKERFDAIIFEDKNIIFNSETFSKQI